MHPKTDKMERLHLICFLGLFGLGDVRGVKLGLLSVGMEKLYMVGVKKYYPLNGALHAVGSAW